MPKFAGVQYDGIFGIMVVPINIVLLNIAISENVEKILLRNSTV